MPGALRWRGVHPLLDEDGSCTLIYDLERAAVVEVPQEFRFHIAPALETGDLDDALLSWLVEEDLLTAESGVTSGHRDIGPGMPGGWDLWAIHRCDDEVHARIAPAVGEVEKTLETIFKQSFGVARVRLLLDWDGALPDIPLLEQVLVAAGRMAAAAHQEVSCEIVLDARSVTRSAAAFLAAAPLHVRLRCGAFPARDSSAEILWDWEARASAVHLLAGLAERTNVQCTLHGGARLLDLWTWAKRAGVRHLDATRSEIFAAGEPPSAGVREHRDDLAIVCDEMVSELAARRVPIDYRPLTRMVRRLMGSEAQAEPGCGLDLGLDRDIPPGSGFRVLDEEPITPCPACWARSLCNHSTLLAAPVGDASPSPSSERCAVWLAEAETALRLYHRLAHCDPMDVLRLLGESARMPLDPLGRWEDLETPKHLF
jgi:hypothetical protein